MSESHPLRELLLPELDAELAKTRKMLEHIPDGHNDFKSAEKSMPLSRLAGHTAELAGFIPHILTASGIDMGTATDPRKILRMETSARLLAEFNAMAATAIATLEGISDEAFYQSFTLARKGVTIIVQTRYNAYRNLAMNHMIHHRAQLGVYLRLLGQPVPGTFGPSADEM